MFLANWLLAVCCREQVGDRVRYDVLLKEVEQTNSYVHKASYSNPRCIYRRTTDKNTKVCKCTQVRCMLFML